MTKFVLLVLVLSASPIPAAELGRWEAGVATRPQGIVAAVKPIPGWTVQTRAGKVVARLNPNTGPYMRSAYVMEVSGRLTGPVWLVVEFLDSGYGLITVSPRISQRDQWGTARVNSGRMRRAVFRYQKPDFPGVIRVEGLDYLSAITLTSSEPPLEQVPLVPPALDFRTPSQRVTTAAGDILDVAFLPERGTIELLETISGSGPSSIANQIAEAVAGLRNQLPLARALGFNGIESYVRWGFVERQPGVWDWSLYDAILDEIEKHGLQWFPMILAGSGYAIPEWLHDSRHNVGFVCLEHGVTHDTQSIFYDYQATYASRFLAEFGKHYGSRRGLLGVRLGPSGDYGEAQYPARGPGYKFRDSHTHIGYWAGDPYAKQSFRKYLRSRYQEIETLNTAWNSRYVSFDGVSTFLPENAITRRQRIDFATWYVGAMSEWCERWAVWARDAMPGTVIHQSSGGWGPVEIGTDYSFQARSMAKVRGGMRLTNEADDFADNFSITRMASSAARFYDAALGFEPGGGHGGARGVSARIFNALTSGAEHLFFYQKDISGNDHGCAAWLKYAGMLDQRAKPVIDVAAFYPDTYAKLENELLRYRWGSTFFNVARALRSEMDFDYASEQMIQDGALERYKVLVFLWGSVTEKSVLDRIDAWVQAGGTVIVPVQPRGFPSTVENDQSIARAWRQGKTSQGQAIFWEGDAIPTEPYAQFIREQLLNLAGIRPRIKAALRMSKPSGVFWSVLENGKLALLNHRAVPASVRLSSGQTFVIEPYGIAVR